MIQLNPEFINKNGQEFVILPSEEFIKIQELLEDLQDLQDLRTAQQEEQESPTFSLDEVKQMLNLS
ncbi:MAG TPA: hypothetical protein V6D21_24815 [Candidatus Obscuribacterales bacterium]